VHKITGDWPGASLKTYNGSWKTYDFEGYSALNLIFNQGSGKSQTSNLSLSQAGYWYFYQNRFYSTDPLEGGQTSSSTVQPEAQDYLDFPLWDELSEKDRSIVSPYEGNRDDFRDEAIYFAMTTRFYNGDPTNDFHCWDGKNDGTDDPEWRGDFKGLIQKMDYIKALGFTAIWITPIVKNSSGFDYHGYHAINFAKVDSRYESEDCSFQDVITAAHARDMKIVLDVVFNHTGNFGEENLFPMFSKSETDLTINGLVPNSNGLLPGNYSSLSGSEQYNARINTMKSDISDIKAIYHHERRMSYESYLEQVGQIAGDCVDLNTENPEVCNYLVKCYGQFIHMGVDAFRIDTMKHISRLSLNRYLFPAFYHYAEICGNPHFYMFGEVCTRVREVWNHGIAADSAPFYTWKENKDYPWGDTATNYTSAIALFQDNLTSSGQPTSTNAFLNGLAYHTPDYSRSSRVSPIDFPMHWNFYYANNAFNVALGGDQYYNDATYNVVYVDSHDYSPDDCQKVRYNRGEAAWAENMDLMFTFRGVPCLYYGSEIQFQAGKVIDDGPNTALKNTGRAYFGERLEGEVSTTGFGQYNASGTLKTTLAMPLAQHLEKLNQIRLKVPALRRGQYTQSNVSSASGMAFTRRYTSQTVDSLALVSISGGASFSSLPNGTYVDLVSGDRKNVTNGTLATGSIANANLRVYVLENASSGVLGQIGGSLTYLR
jgi:glycosidase